MFGSIFIVNQIFSTKYFKNLKNSKIIYCLSLFIWNIPFGQYILKYLILDKTNKKNVEFFITYLFIDQA